MSSSRSSSSSSSESETAATTTDTDFDVLATEIREVLAELSEDKSLEAFKKEYEKLFNALKRYNNNLQQSKTQCSTLNAEIAQQLANLESAEIERLELEEREQSLRSEVNKAWKMVDLTQEREERARETIETLNAEIQNLTKALEEQTLAAEDTNLNELRKLRDELIAQRDALRQEVAQLKSSVEDKSKENSALIDKVKLLNNDLRDSKNALQAKSNELNREVRRKERAERECKQLKMELETQKANLEQMEQRSSSFQSDKIRVEETLRNLQASQVDQDNKIRDLEQQLESERNNLETQKNINEMERGRTNELNEQIVEFKAKVIEMKSSMTQKMRQSENIRKEGLKHKSQNEALLTERSKLREETKVLREALQRERDALLRHRKSADAEKSRFTQSEKTIKHLESQIERLRREVRNNGEERSQLLQTIVSLETNLKRHTKQVCNAEIQRDHYREEAQLLALKVDELLGEASGKEHLMKNLQKASIKLDLKGKEQHNLFIAATHDRMVSEKRLLSAQESNEDLRAKLRVLQHQFGQMKEERVVMEHQAIKLNNSHQAIIKEKDALNTALDEAQVSIGDLQSELERSKETLTQKERQLTQIEGELKHFKCLKDQKQSQILLLGSKVKALEEEKICLEHKIESHLQDSRLKDDLRGDLEKTLLKTQREFRDLSEECLRLREDRQKLKSLQREMLLQQKELTKERVRSARLKVECETPVNVHRFRQLEHRDPEYLELLKTIHCLQKSLNKRQRELSKRDTENENQKRALLELEKTLERHRSNETRLSEFRELSENLKKQREKSKVLEAENNLLRSKAKAMEEEVRRVRFEVGQRRCYSANNRTSIKKKNNKGNNVNEKNERMIRSASVVGVKF